MSFYQKIADVGSRYIPKHKLFKYGFNLSPMYRRSTGRIVHVSPDLLCVKIKLPINYKNRNYVNSIFGGSMFSAVDPIPMVQLINLLGDEYVVWDKSAEVHFKRPAREILFASFEFTPAELEEIKRRIKKENEIEIIKSTVLTDKDANKEYCQIDKRIYVADKAYFKSKRSKTSESKA